MTEAADTPSVGTVIDGRYRIEARLGAGGAGTVYRCTDLELGTPVALKVLSADADLARWRREVALARKITDRNVCRVHDLGDTAEFRFVTMELVEGVGLRDKVGTSSPDQARELIAQLVSGVAAIHAAGIVHRDLKPENVVVEPSGRAVIVDFGIAKLPTTTQATRPMDAANPMVPLTLAGYAVGTPRYMAPEQAEGRSVDPRADVWALGLIAHELVTGNLPEVTDEGRRIAPSFADRWPAGAAIVERCLAADPARRFADARELGDALASAPGTKAHEPVQPQTVQLRPSPATEQPTVQLGRATTPDQNRTVDLRTPSPVEPGRTVDLRTPASSAPAHQPPVPRDAPPRSKPAGGKLAFAIAATGALGVISFVLVKAVRTPAVPDAPSVTEAAVADTPPSMVQLTTTSDAQWPAASPTSVALDPTGTKFAFTTGDGQVHVRDLAGGTVTDWPAPTVKPRDTALTLSSPQVVGWYSDGALAITGATTSHLYLIELRSDGTSDIRVTSASRFRVAVSPGGKVAVADRSTIHELDGGAHGSAEPDEVIALTWVGDKQLAWLQISRQPATAGATTLVLEGAPLWTGHTDPLIDPLLVSVGTKLVFSIRDGGRTRISSIDPATKQVTLIEELAAHVGAGTAAKGTVVLVKGDAREVVQLRERYGSRAALAHDPDVRGSDVAGYTPDGAVVFRAGEQIVTGMTVGTNSKSWRVTPWPGTTTRDLPVALAGADLLVRDERAQSTTWKLTRVAPDGTRTVLAPIENALAVRCAAGCVVQQRDGGDTFSDLDPATGEIGRRIYRHSTWASDFTLSPTLLVLATGSTVLPVDRATGAAMMKPYPASIETRWRAIAIDDAGDLWTSAVPLDRVPLGFARSHADTLDGSLGWIRPSNIVLHKSDALRWFGRVALRGTESDQRMAVETTELRLEIWRADHLGH